MRLVRYLLYFHSVFKKPFQATLKKFACSVQFTAKTIFLLVCPLSKQAFEVTCPTGKPIGPCKLNGTFFQALPY